MGKMIKVGMADLNLCQAPDAITTLGLGSCVGVVLYDANTKIAGLVHVMLPDSTKIKNNENIAKFADTGMPIVFIQTALKKLVNYEGEISGNFGLITEKYVSIFQEEKGMESTGVCDEVTLYKLICAYLGIEDILPPQPTPTPVMPEPQFVMTLPVSLQTIGEESFAGSGVQAFMVGSQCMTIESRAFADCQNLVLITLPASVSFIADDAFEGCGGFVLAAPAGSYAIAYAQRKGYDYVELE